MHSTLFSAAVVAAVINGAFAQTSTSCNPLNTTCPSDPALGKTITVDFTKGASDQFTIADGTTLTYNSNGAQFAMTGPNDAPTISSNWYIMFGKVDVVMMAAPGTGIVSSVVLESDDLDEVDIEWLGGDTKQVQSNYFGKGNTTSYDRGGFHDVSNPQTTFHTYTLDWTKDTVKWSIDGAVVRTLAYADAVGGKNYPQTPMRVKLGNWDGGASTQPKGTIQWAGGLTDWDNSASYTMQIKSITIQDYTTTGSEYIYGDNSGSYESIKVEGAAGGSNGTVPVETSSVAVKPSSTVVSSVISTASNGSKTTLATTITTAAAIAVASHIGNAPTATTTTPVEASTTGAPAGSGFVQNASGTSSSASATSTSNAASGVKPSKYGVLDLAVVGLGLGLGYLVM